MKFLLSLFLLFGFYGPNVFAGDIPCVGANCTLDKTVSIDIDVLRGGVDHNLYVCGLKLTNTCDTCHDDTIDVLDAQGHLIPGIPDLTDPGAIVIGFDQQPKTLIVNLNSLAQGASFSLMFCDDLRRVVVGDDLNWSAAAGTITPHLHLVAGTNDGDEDIYNLDHLTWSFSRMCGTDTQWTLIPPPGGVNQVNPGLSVDEDITGIPSIPLVVENSGDLTPDDPNHGPVPAGEESWRCLKGSCKYMLSFTELDNCFRTLDTNCRNAGGCKGLHLNLHADLTSHVNFSCLKGCP
jgi:hypothetical protein